MATITDKIYLI